MKTSWRWALIAGSALVGAVLAPPLETPVAALASNSDRWQLPDLPRKPDQAALALALSSSTIFEPEAKMAAQAAAAAQPPPDERWRIAGILGRDTARSVLVTFNDPTQPAQTLRVGDRLPSGHRIQRIEPHAVCVQQGPKILRIGVQTRD
jgi:hypothetical protein